MAAHPTVGHTQALRAIGRELRARGDEVHFAVTVMPSLPAWVPVPAPMRSAADVARGVVADGFTRVPLPKRLATGWAAHNVARSRGYDELDWALRLFTADAQADARVMVRHLERWPADVVVADCFHYGAWLAAEVRRVPLVAVFHSGLPFPAPGAPPFGSPLGGRGRDAESARRLSALSARVDVTLGDARRALGLPAIAPGVLERPYATALNVLTTFEAFELPRPSLAAQAAGPVLWAGPCLGSRRPQVEFPWGEVEGARPLVYVSLGTVFNDQPEVYRVLLAGVHAAGARAVVAAGASLEAVRRVARAGDVVVRFAPQVELLPHVDAAIVHGGNNSTNEVLRAGKPLLSVPFGAEQRANARRAVGLGVARALEVDTLAAGEVAEALAWLLTPEPVAAARALAAAVPQEDGVVRVVAELDRIAGRSAR